MNFPMQYPIFQFFYWMVNTAGVGGVVAGLVAGGSILSYLLVLRWIALGGSATERETYAYPTPALHEQHTGEH